MEYSSFQVQLDDCTFLNESQIIERKIYNSSQGSLGALDYEKNKDIVLGFVVIKVHKKLEHDEYDFYSPSYSTSIDDLKIRIEFFKSILVHYNTENPMEYYFECKST